MTCTVLRPTPQAAFQRLLNNFSTTVLGGSPVIPESNEWYVVANDFAAQQELFSIIDQQLIELDPRTACCDNLVSIAEVDGVYPRAAVSAQGYVRITGTFGAAIPVPLDITLGANVYRAIGTVPSTMPVAGSIIVRVQAILPGAAGNNLPASKTGILTQAAVGLDREVTSYGSSFCSGADAEACEAFRTRYLARKAYKPRATMAWIKEKILEWPCATRVYERAGNCCSEDCPGGCSCTECGSALDFYVLFDNTFDCGIPPQCVIDDMNVWLFGETAGRGMGLVEVGVCGRIHQLVPSTVNIIVSGLYCSSPSETEEIRARIEEIFIESQPSVNMSIRPFELAVAQIAGASVDFEVIFSVADGTITLDDCGGLDVPCDVLPCLGSVTFQNAGSAITVCIE